MSCVARGPGLILVPPDSGPTRVLVPDSGGRTSLVPQWSPDSRTVYNLFADSLGMVGVSAVPVAGGTARVLVRFDDPSRPWHRYGFRARGGRFYFTVGDLESDIWVAELERHR